VTRGGTTGRSGQTKADVPIRSVARHADVVRAATDRRGMKRGAVGVRDDELPLILPVRNEEPTIQGVSFRAMIEVPSRDAEPRLPRADTAPAAADEGRRDPAHRCRCGQIYCRTTRKSASGPLGPHCSTPPGFGGRSRNADRSSSPCFTIGSSISKRRRAETSRLGAEPS
jgi:hypothetical protein